MNDYLANLVIRSFAPVVPFQPLAAPLPAPQEIFQSPVPEVSDLFDPFAQPAIPGGEELTAAAPEPSSRRKRVPHSLDPSAAPLATDQESVAGTLDDMKPGATGLSFGRLPGQAESAAPPIQPSDRRSDETRRLPPGTQRAPALSDTAADEISWQLSETSSAETSEPIRKAVEPAKRLATPNLQLRPIEIFAEITPAQPANDGLYESGQKRKGVPSARISGQTDVTEELQPVDSGRSSWPSLKRQAKDVSLTSPPAQASLDRVAFPATLTTLVPKSRAEALPQNARSRPRLSFRNAFDESATQPPPAETVINVAIGRIEVRATPADSVRRERQRTRPKTMNLDDYQQQRSRGNR
ncbi:MAG TPA: hypothetical protein VGN90_04950 [Pyrinomonadaceae bacterium]|jgi:hypothetical protein|nr:hypothetical protein [Pyrinomonadaceae bacterium]